MASSQSNSIENSLKAGTTNRAAQSPPTPDPARPKNNSARRPATVPMKLNPTTSPLRIGLLKCDTDPELLRSEFGEQEHRATALLKAHDPSLDLPVFAVCRGEYPQAPDDCDGYVCLGTIEKERYEASLREGAAPLPSLHSALFYPAPEPTLRRSIEAMGNLALGLLAPLP